MEQFIVVATPDAEEDVERCYRYILDHFKNEAAAESFLLDYEETLYMLSIAASALQIGIHPLLAKRNLRRINFQRH